MYKTTIQDRFLHMWEKNLLGLEDLLKIEEIRIERRKRKQKEQGGEGKKEYEDKEEERW